MARQKGEWVTLSHSYEIHCDSTKTAYKMPGNGRYQVVEELTSVPSGHISDGHPRTVNGEEAKFPGDYPRKTTPNTQVQITDVNDDSTYKVKVYLDVVHVQ